MDVRIEEDDETFLTLSIDIKYQRRDLQHKPSRNKVITLAPDPPGLLHRSERRVLLGYHVPHRTEFALLHLFLLHPHLSVYPKKEDLGPTNSRPLFERHRPLLHIRNLQHYLRHRDAQCAHLPSLEPADVSSPQGRHFIHLLHGWTVSIAWRVHTKGSSPN